MVFVQQPLALLGLLIKSVGHNPPPARSKRFKLGS